MRSGPARSAARRPGARRTGRRATWACARPCARTCACAPRWGAAVANQVTMSSAADVTRLLEQDRLIGMHRECSTFRLVVMSFSSASAYDRERTAVSGAVQCAGYAPRSCPECKVSAFACAVLLQLLAGPTGISHGINKPSSVGHQGDTLVTRCNGMHGAFCMFHQWKCQFGGHALVQATILQRRAQELRASLEGQLASGWRTFEDVVAVLVAAGALAPTTLEVLRLCPCTVLSWSRLTVRVRGGPCHRIRLCTA